MPPLPNQRQEKFCRTLVSGKSASKAYELAGYEPNRHNASRLKTNENVNRRIRELAMPAAKRAQVTTESLLDELEEARQHAIALGAPSTEVSAVMGKARITGKDTARVEVSTINFEAMRSDEIEAALIKLLQDHGVIAADPPMIDVTPESESQ